MIRPPPISTRTATPFPYTTLFRAPQRLEGPVTVPRTHVEHAPPREVFRHPVNVGIQGIRARRDDAVGQLDAVIPERMGVDAPSQIHCLHACRIAQKPGTEKRTDA